MLKSRAQWQLYIRHAHRETYDRSLDNGLSEKGHQQAEQLVEVLEQVPGLTRPKKILSSPKLRCLQTAEHLARWIGGEVIVEPLLDEQRPKEEAPAFFGRIAKFLVDHQKSSEVAFVSHGDVLALMARFYGSPKDQVRKGDFFLVRAGQVEIFNGSRGD